MRGWKELIFTVQKYHQKKVSTIHDTRLRGFDNKE